MLERVWPELFTIPRLCRRQPHSPPSSLLALDGAQEAIAPLSGCSGLEPFRQKQAGVVSASPSPRQSLTGSSLALRES